MKALPYIATSIMSIVVGQNLYFILFVDTKDWQRRIAPVLALVIGVVTIILLSSCGASS